MNGTKRYSTLPENADKVLFAEDFVNHILLKFKLPLLSSGIADHRAHVYNAFNSNVRLATDYLYSCFEMVMSQEFENIETQRAIDIDAFFLYAIPLTSHFQTRILQIQVGIDDLIKYCLKISTMAAKFYMHGFLVAPVLAVDLIIRIMNGINMMEGGWRVMNNIAAEYAQISVDMDNDMTPESSPVNDWESDSSSSRNSEASHSPDHEADGGEDQDQHSEELTEDDVCKMCLAALNSSEEPASSSSTSKHVEKMIDVKADSAARSFDNTPDSVSSGSSKEKCYETYYHSFEEACRQDDGSKQNMRKRENKKVSCSCTKISNSGSDKRETDIKQAVYIDPFRRQLTEKGADILSCTK